MQNPCMFSQISHALNLAVIATCSAVGLMGCASYAGHKSGIAGTNTSSRLAPVAIALGPVDVSPMMAPGQSRWDAVVPVPSGIDAPERGDVANTASTVPIAVSNHQLQSVRARSTPSEFRTAGAAALATSLEQLSNVYRMVNGSDISFPAAETEKPSHALCSGSAIIVHENGGGLRAATLRLSEDIVIPFGTVWCGEGEIAQVITLADQ